MVWFFDFRNKYLRLSKPMFLTVGTYLSDMWNGVAIQLDPKE
jgi:hypothetical protein